MLLGLGIILIGLLVEFKLLIYMSYRNKKTYELTCRILEIICTKDNWRELMEIYESVSYEDIWNDLKPIKVESYYPLEFCNIINNR